MTFIQKMPLCRARFLWAPCQAHGKCSLRHSWNPPHTVALNVEWVTPNLETPPSIDPHCFLLSWPVSLKVNRHLILLPPRTEELLPCSSGPAIHRISAPLLLPKLDQIIISLLLPLAPSKHLSSLSLCGIIPGLVKVFIKDRKRSCHFFFKSLFCSLWGVDSQGFLAVSAEKSSLLGAGVESSQASWGDRPPIWPNNQPGRANASKWRINWWC